MAVNTATTCKRREASLSDAPLLPLSLAATAGIVLDRALEIPLPLAVLGAFALLALAARSIVGGMSSATPFCLWAATACAGAAYHHWHCHALREDDIAHVISEQPRPFRLRGIVSGDADSHRQQVDPLSAYPDATATRFTLWTTAVRHGNAWPAASGYLQVIVEGDMPELRSGDAVEVIGQLAMPSSPGNPGEFDYAQHLRDRGMRGVLQVRNTTAAVTRLSPHPFPLSPWGRGEKGEGQPHYRSPIDGLARIQAWAKRVLETHLPTEQHGVAGVLLLGDDDAMRPADWEKYLVTGVVHVLAISGQHLAVLGGFVWVALRLARVRRKTIALSVALFALGYGLLVGGRPPVMRAAGMVAVLCGGLLCQRRVSPANSFAFTWLAVLIINPTDIFNTGCQLSFLAVAVLVWGAVAWNNRRRDRLEQVAMESRPLALDVPLRAIAFVAAAYIINAAVWFAVTPLVASRHHLISPVAIIVGPPMILFSSIALVAGFMLLLFGHMLWPLSYILAAGMSGSLTVADRLANIARDAPYAYFYVPDVPTWLLALFYIGVFAVLVVGWLRRHWRLWASAALVWCLVLAAWLLPRHEPFRCCFVAVGHGGCTVIETRDKVLVYDAGAITGPEVTRRSIAPYLWSRGISRIDELFLSHADLDHFNGVPALIDRFRVQRVHITPTFSERQTPAARVVLDALQKRNIATNFVSAGMRFDFDALSMDVLHPPADGRPQGRENVRSLVMLCRAGGRSILLTGDLEGKGLEHVLQKPALRVDALMAPHHGSKTANTPALAAWANPKIVVSCQGRDWRVANRPEPYTQRGARYLPTWPHGAVTIRQQGDEFVVETFRSRQRIPF